MIHELAISQGRGKDLLIDANCNMHDIFRASFIRLFVYSSISKDTAKAMITDCPDCDPCPYCNGGTEINIESDETAECSCAFEDKCKTCNGIARIIKE